MILDLARFVAAEQPYWTELDRTLAQTEANQRRKLTLDEVRRFHYLYERTCAGLAKINTFSSEPETRRYLESLVSRAYGELHETRGRRTRLAPWTWFTQTLPQTFRRHVRAFWLSTAVTLVGMIFGGLAVAFDTGSKSVILPEMFANHGGDPAERVAREERERSGPSADRLTSFSAQLMVNNIMCSIKALAFGITYGVGTLVLLFYNGVIIGLISVDYVMAGQTIFLLGWLLPHGVIEIPAVLIAGQAGLMLAGALIGWGQRTTIRARLRALAPDLTTLIFGVALMLVWAGIIEAFFSQYHAPVLPYWVKISFGCTELALLILFLARCGKNQSAPNTMTPPIE